MRSKPRLGQNITPPSFKSTKLKYEFDENPKTAQIQGPMIKSRTKQLVNTFQQMILDILNKAQLENDGCPEALPRIFIVAEDPN